MPTQVFVSVTPEVQNFLRECRVEGAASKADEEGVDMDELYRLVDEHQRLGGKPVKIHELLERAEVVSRKASDESPLTELQRLRAQAEERKYQRMVQGVAPLNQRKAPDPAMDGISWATNFGTQVIVAFIGAFLLGYFFVETFVAPDNNVAKAIAGAACSFATLLLETCLLMVHESKEQMIKRKQEERGERERQRKAKKAAQAAAGREAVAADAAAAAAVAAGEAPADSSPSSHEQGAAAAAEDDAADAEPQEAEEAKGPREKKED